MNLNFTIRPIFSLPLTGKEHYKHHYYQLYQVVRIHSTAKIENGKRKKHIIFTPLSTHKYLVEAYKDLSMRILFDGPVNLINIDEFKKEIEKVNETIEQVIKETIKELLSHGMSVLKTSTPPKKMLKKGKVQSLEEINIATEDWSPWQLPELIDTTVWNQEQLYWKKRQEESDNQIKQRIIALEDQTIDKKVAVKKLVTKSAIAKVPVKIEKRQFKEKKSKKLKRLLKKS
jgi:hypothetical protein